MGAEEAEVGTASLDDLAAALHTIDDQLTAEQRALLWQVFETGRGAITTNSGGAARPVAFGKFESDDDDKDEKPTSDSPQRVGRPTD